MEQPNWKQRVEQLPVLGSLLSGLRGVFTLRVWRAEMRRDIALLHDRADAASIGQARLQERVDELGRNLGGLDERFVGLVERVQALEQGFERLSERQSQLDDVAMCFRAEVNRCASDLAHARRDIRRLGAEIRFAQEGPAPQDGRTGETPAGPGACGSSGSAVPAALAAGDAADTDALLAPFDHVLASLWSDPQAPIIHLHALPVSRWIDALREAGGNAAAVTALAGADLADAPDPAVLFDAAQAALRPDGVMVVRYANPENLVVAAHCLQADPPLRAVPPARAEILARRAGFVRTGVLRFDADDEAHRLPGEGLAVERLNQLLSGPRSYGVVGWKA